MRHIAICICTFKRPVFLKDLLLKLQDQITNNLFTYSIIIVDNDRDQTAKKVFNEIQKKSKILIEYYNEPKQSISFARNKILDNAKGDLLAFIDDDEFPINEWLLTLLNTLDVYKCDGVLGPVRPHFLEEPPKWLKKSNYFFKEGQRPEFNTGFKLNYRQTRTGSVLIKKEIFNDRDNRFDPKYGLTGGEDKDLFRRLIEKGYTFIWCNEAIAYEKIPKERFKRSYFLKYALRSGSTSLKNSSFKKKGILKSFFASVLYTLMLPFLFFIGDHLFMEYLCKDISHLGKILAFCGIILVDKRDEFQN